MKALFQRLIKDEEGANMVEYGLLGGLIAVALIGGIIFFRDGLKTFFNKSGDCVQNPTTCQPL